METLDVQDSDEEIVVKSGSLALRINKQNFVMSYERDGEVITTSGWRDLAYLKTDWKGDAYNKGYDDSYLHAHFGPNEVKHKGKRLYKRN